MPENLIHPGKLCFKILLCLRIYTFFPKMKKLEVKKFANDVLEKKDRKSAALCQRNVLSRSYINTYTTAEYLLNKQRRGSV
jgi:hypothetical protein